MGKTRNIRVAVAAAAVATAVAGSMLTAAPAGAYNVNAHLWTGVKDPVFTVTQSAGGGSALTSSAARTLLTNTGAPVFSYGVYDCFTGSTCGDPEASQSHAGTISAANFSAQIATIRNSLNDPVLVLTMLPVTKSALTNSNGTVDGTSFCPTLTTASKGTANPVSDEWGLNLPYDKAIIDAVVASGVTPNALYLESSNEAENDCFAKWGYTSTAATGVSKALGHMFAATMDGAGGLLAYARAQLPNTLTGTIGYIGTAGGTARGDSCTANPGSPFGYQCTFTKAKAQVDDFNNTILADAGTTGWPGIESIHSYCHSPDFTTASGYPLPDNECYAFYREWATMFDTEVHNIWGANPGDNILKGITEWQAGVCGSTNATCWSGFANGAGNDTAAYDSGFWSMLAGSNSQLSGLGSTRFYLGIQFDDAGNADGTGLPGAPDNNASPGGNYNVINKAGTKGEGYTALCNATGVGVSC